METPQGDMPLDPKHVQRIREFRLMDDLFMQVFLHDNIPCVQLILRIILDKPDLIVVSAKTQHPLQSLHGKRSLRLDVFATDSRGRLYNLEIQRTGIDAERGRLHSSVMDASTLEAGKEFSSLPETWVIFIMEHDPFGLGLPLYHFVRYMPEAGLPLNDGSHILYANGALRDGSTMLSRLMHDFFCADPDAMLLDPLARMVRDFKQRSEGVRKVSSVIEAIRAEGWTEGRAENQKTTALHMLRMGRFTLEDIAEITRLSLDEVRALAEMPPR